MSFKPYVMTKKELAALYGISTRTLSRIVRMFNDKSLEEDKIDYAASPLTIKAVEKIVKHIGEP